MAEGEKKVRGAVKMCPCPAYDIEVMESWLEDMAASGLHLAEDGFFAGFARFERGEPKKVRYRLEAAEKGTSMWSDTGGAPEDEALEINESCGWEYVAARDGFHIYRSESEEARELNTDPQVQALAIEKVRRRERGSVVSCVFWFVLYPLAFINLKIFLLAAAEGTWFVLWSVALAVWITVNAVRKAGYLRRLKRRLTMGEELSHRKPWRRGAPGYRAGRVLITVFVLAWCVVLAGKLLSSASEEVKVDLEGFEGDMPFATMADLAGGEAADYRLFPMTGITNYMEERSDIIAPVAISWHEVADVSLPDGRLFSGGLYAEYFETAAPWIARQITREYMMFKRWDKDFQEYGLPDLDVDYAIAYRDDSTHFVTVLIRDGCVVIKASLYQTSPNFTLKLSEWASRMADSIRER